MSTSDQQEQGPLTRKQLREIRLTGSTPVISNEEAAAAVEAAPPAPPVPPLPRAAEPVEVSPAPEPVDDAQGDAPLTRRQARELEKVRTASVPVIGADDEDTTAQPTEETTREPEPEPEPVEAPPRTAAPEPGDDDDMDDAVDVVPVRASDVSDSIGDVPLDSTDEPAGDLNGEDDVEAVLGIAAEDADAGDGDVLADVQDDDVTDVAEERPTVNPAFGETLLEAPEERAPFRPSFDELLTVGDSTGSQHSAPNALIFTPSPGEGSLSGPVASTGEILVTGSYELPHGMGSQGHALGTTDGKDVDAVLIDGELPPASSPTPIAASSAVSTIKPAGEVIRPPAPEKGNRLMVILAIVAGGLALAVGVAVIIAFTTNVF
ncbi:hypothetical protein [Microbacterium sp. MYb62]|uniref:hypothetical protein n=1 Tax=Microbacterium sp. MYb62 TaxID=1848690 RepID=UPI000CFDBDF2|nr:hypothetical protein [Microbacterium sp. MYb62]PRB09565.1 hypothetical protein CQ042_19155 [Microbacterium sp. MYb62]